MSNKVVMITGASSGFGLLTALRFAEEGYQVIATMRDPDKRNQLMEEAIRKQVDTRITCWKLDVTNETEALEIAARIKKEFGRLHILVNNAGYAVGGMAEEVPLEEWRKQFDTNFFGTVQVTKAMLPLMREQREGLIFNISSVSGKFGIPGYGPYCSSKFALEGFSESLRLELHSFGIKVVLIEPGAFRTPIWSKGFEHIHAIPNSPYGKLLDAVLHLSRLTAESAPDPELVARKIVRIAKMKSPSLRYAIGNGIRTTLAGKSLLPWNTFERILLKTLNK